MGHLLKIKCVDSRVNVHILASTSVPFTLTTVQVQNLAITHKKRITVHFRENAKFLVVIADLDEKKLLQTSPKIKIS